MRPRMKSLLRECLMYPLGGRLGGKSTSVSPESARQKPKRYGTGRYMTFAVVAHENWLRDDLEETVENVKGIDDWLHAFQAYLNQISPTAEQ